MFVIVLISRISIEDFNLEHDNAKSRRPRIMFPVQYFLLIFISRYLKNRKHVDVIKSLRLHYLKEFT